MRVKSTSFEASLGAEYDGAKLISMSLVGKAVIFRIFIRSYKIVPFGLKSAYNPIFITSKTHEPPSSDSEADVSETNEAPTDSSPCFIAKAAASSAADDTVVRSMQKNL